MTAPAGPRDAGTGGCRCGRPSGHAGWLVCVRSLPATAAPVAPEPAEWAQRAHRDPYCATHCRPGHKHSQCGCPCDHAAPPAPVAEPAETPLREALNGLVSALAAILRGSYSDDISEEAHLALVRRVGRAKAHADTLLAALPAPAVTGCPMCEHAPHGDTDCGEVTGYDHLNGDHECGCPGPAGDAHAEGYWRGYDQGWDDRARHAALPAPAVPGDAEIAAPGTDDEGTQG